MLSLDIHDQLKTNFHRTNKGQRAPMVQCLLRTLAFLQKSDRFFFGSTIKNIYSLKFFFFYSHI
jgi:hypothetical protein